MQLKMNLVAILMTLICVGCAHDSVPVSADSKDKGEVVRMGLDQRIPEFGRKLSNGNKKVIKSGVKLPQNAIVLYGANYVDHGKVPKVNRHANQRKQNITDISKAAVEERVHPRRKKHMDRTMMALLLAYKMKFIALIPTMMGGLILLISTALLAGFFFALFAAVVGLRAH